MSINFKAIIRFFKQYWVFILLAAIVAVLLAFWFLRQPKAPPETIPVPTHGNLPQPQSELSQPLGEGLFYTILFSENDFTKIPKALPIYYTQEFTKEEILSRLAKMVVDLGFLSGPEEQRRGNKQVLVWREGENYLKANIPSSQFTFVGKSQINQNQTITASQAENLVSEKLVSWNLVDSKPTIEKTEGFIPVGLELSPVANLKQATVFNIIFEPTFEQYPLIGIGQAINPLEAKIDNQGNLLNLFFSLHQVDPKIVDNYPLKSYEETINEIKSGRVQIIEVTQGGQNQTIPSPENIQEIRIASLSPAYYETTETQEYYQPIFLLKGSVVLKEGGIYQASLILPAISSEYLQPQREYFKF